MNFDELYKFLGYGLVCLLLFYIVSKSIRFQLGIIEGLVGIKDKKLTRQAQAKQSQSKQDQAKADDDDDQKDQAEEDQAEEDQADMNQAELDHE